VRYVFVRDHRWEFPVNAMCRVLEAPRSGFYAWLASPESQRVRTDRRLLVAIKELHRRSDRSYGSPRITEALRTRGLHLNHKRVERLMAAHGIRSVHRRKYRVTTDSSHTSPVAPNVLARCFEASAPNQKWVADITYLWTEEGWLYLAAVMDLYSRRIVGHAMGSRLKPELVLDALRMAFHRRSPGPGLLHHSDRGIQYAAGVYQQALARWGIVCSMSRKGDCYDNAVMESFFKTLKVERVYQRRYVGREQARWDVSQWIESFDNSWRIHSALGYLSPAEFEMGARAA
jgi:transposase InsO family protein